MIAQPRVVLAVKTLLSRVLSSTCWTSRRPSSPLTSNLSMRVCRCTRKPVLFKQMLRCAVKPIGDRRSIAGEGLFVSGESAAAERVLLPRVDCVRGSRHPVGMEIPGGGGTAGKIRAGLSWICDEAYLISATPSLIFMQSAGKHSKVPAPPPPLPPHKIY